MLPGARHPTAFTIRNRPPWLVVCSRDGSVWILVREERVMGTSLLWQTDSQLHDSVQRELGTALEVDATGVAVLALQRWPSVPRTVIVTVRDGFLTLEGHVAQ